MQLIQVVPNLPPNLSGVGDYALLLAHALRRDHEIDTCFWAARENWRGSAEIDGFKVSKLTASFGLRETDNEDAQALLLHYVGYGYSKRGAPLWLVRWLRSLMRESSKLTVVTFFHELFASGPPWSSAFWLSPVQRWVCGQLAKLSHGRMTNRAASAAILKQMSPDHRRAVAVLPVVSNFGEPAFFPLLRERRPQMVVYGGLCRFNRDRKLAASALRRLAHRAGIERLIAFGPKSLTAADTDLPMENRGVLSRIQIIELLLQSRAGYIDYPVSCLGKSTIFAAHCAHGIVPVLLRSDCAQADRLRVGKHLLSALDQQAVMSVHELQWIASAAHEWYQGHRLSVLGDAVARIVGTNVPLDSHR